MKNLFYFKAEPRLKCPKKASLVFHFGVRKFSSKIMCSPKFRLVRIILTKRSISLSKYLLRIKRCLK